MLAEKDLATGFTLRGNYEQPYLLAANNWTAHAAMLKCASPSILLAGGARTLQSMTRWKTTNDDQMEMRIALGRILRAVEWCTIGGSESNHPEIENAGQKEQRLPYYV